MAYVQLEDDAQIAVANFGIGAARLGFVQIPRDQDIESLYFYIAAGALTIANGNTEVGSLLEGLDFTIKYDQTILHFHGVQVPALSNFWYGANHPVRVGAGCYQDNAKATICGNMDVRARLKVNCQAKPGTFMTVTLDWQGEALVSETVANTTWAASTCWFTKRYGNFNAGIACDYELDLAVAAMRQNTPPVQGDVCAGVIWTARANSAAYVADAGALDRNSYPAQCYETDWITQLIVTVGATPVAQSDIPCGQRQGFMERSQDDGALATALGHTVGYLPLGDVILKIEHKVSGNVIIKYNANTADVYVLTIWTYPGAAVGYQDSKAVPSTSSGPAGTVASGATNPKAGGKVEFGAVSGDQARSGRTRNVM